MHGVQERRGPTQGGPMCAEFETRLITTVSRDERPGVWLVCKVGGERPKGRSGSQAREGHSVDALAPGGDEGRGTLRKATGSREQALIRGYPNGETHPQGYRQLNT